MTVKPALAAKTSRSPKRLSPAAWFELLIPQNLRDAPIQKFDSVHSTAGKLGEHNIAMASLVGSAGSEISEPDSDALARVFDEGARRAGLVLVSCDDEGLHALADERVTRARDRLAVSRRPMIVVLTAPTGLHAGAVDLAATADIILAEKSPSLNQALEEGLVDQIVERGRLPGVLRCLFDAVSVPEQLVG